MSFEEWEQENFAYLLWRFNKSGQPPESWKRFCRDLYMEYSLRVGDMLHEKIRRLPIERSIQHGER